VSRRSRSHGVRGEQRASAGSRRALAPQPASVASAARAGTPSRRRVEVGARRTHGVAQIRSLAGAAARAGGSVVGARRGRSHAAP
jgi:hypothetical protein